MNKSTNAARGVVIYGATLAAMLVMSAVGLSAAFVTQHNGTKHTKTIPHTLNLWKQQRTMMTLSSRGDKGLLTSRQLVHYSPWHRAKLTWYSPLQGTGDGHTTATGTRVRNGWTIAVDPNVIPYGSLVEIRFKNGTTHVYYACDTGGAIRGAHIDIYDSNNAECLRNGVQYGDYRILDES